MPNPHPRASGTMLRALPDRLLSDAEFGRTLDNFLTGPAASGYAVRLTVISTGNGEILAQYRTREVPDDTPSQSRMLLEDGTSAVRCRCELWRQRAQLSRRSDADALVEGVTALIDRHWGERDPATALPFLKSPTGPARFAAVAREFAASGRPMAVLHTDLDHFKAINAEHGEPTGDRALREFADRFRNQVGPLGVVVRTGGEEFSALLDATQVGAVLRAADGLRRCMEREPLRAIGRANTCSIGLCFYLDAGCFAEAEHPDAVLLDARRAEHRAKQEGRNRIALVGPTPATDTLAEAGDEELMAAALAARSWGTSGGTGETLREAVEARMVEAFAEGCDLASAVAGIERAFSLKVGRFRLPADAQPGLLGVIGSLEWAGMVARSLLRCTFEQGRPLRPADRLALVAAADGTLSLDVSGRPLPLSGRIAAGLEVRAAIGAPFFPVDRAPPGGLARAPRTVVAAGCDACSPILLMPIGDAARAVTEGLGPVAAAVLEIDDRPTRIGGLPDFWQSNVWRVIQACLANPNIEAVIAVGEVSFARLTIDRLNARCSGGPNGLQRRLCMRPDDLDVFAGRQLRVTTVPADRRAVLAQIEQVVAAMAPLDFAERPSINLLNRGRRRLPVVAPDQTHRLETSDGLRTRTLSDAYPEALQLIRSGSGDTDQVETHRGILRELTGFKVVLTEPLADRVPDYWQEDRGVLDDYYDRVFVRPDGLIGSRLHRPFGAGGPRLADYAAAQTAEAACCSLPTRRINLPVVPESLDQPLGLSSVQVMPRERNGVAVLDMIYVWRAVDALVGFPFSAYGSICWAEELLARVNDRLKSMDAARQLRMGTLTYIALSFHMYLHDGETEMARSIVHAASM